MIALSFDDGVSAALRAQLGDFRDEISFAPAIFEDIAARSNFYIDHGLNTELTDFPAPAFRQGLQIVRLKSDLPPPLAVYRPDDAPLTSGEEEEAGYRRTNAAHDQLLRMETRLRRFIDAVMTAGVGPDWPTTHLRVDLYQKWTKKKAKAEGVGMLPHPLVAYADFTEYSTIICEPANWPMFAQFFMRPESVRDSFQRLGPLRIATMHVRLLTQDDELYLTVEVKRLWGAINSMK